MTAGGDNTSTTFSGVISGSGGLVKQGTGTMTLTGASSYGGATNTNAGTLQAGAANTLSASSAHTVSAGAVLDLNNFNQTVGSLAGAGNVTLGSATLTAGGDNTSTTFSGVISGSGGLVKQGTGTMTLTGANSYSGGTTVSAGALQGNTASLQGNIVNNAAVTFDQATTGTYAGSMSGSGSLTKQECRHADPDRRQQLFGRHDGVGGGVAGQHRQPAGQHRQQRRGDVRPGDDRHLRRKHVGQR